jgi:hypothetical protein
MKLRMKYDDGFIAWINGSLIASNAAPATPAWNSLATLNRNESLNDNWTDFTVPLAAVTLNTGTNVLAIQGFNVTTSSSDFLLLPSLEATFAGGLVRPARLFHRPHPRRAQRRHRHCRPPAHRGRDHPPPPHRHRRQPARRDERPGDQDLQQHRRRDGQAGLARHVQRRDRRHPARQRGLARRRRGRRRLFRQHAHQRRHRRADDPVALRGGRRLRQHLPRPALPRPARQRLLPWHRRHERRRAFLAAPHPALVHRPPPTSAPPAPSPERAPPFITSTASTTTSRSISTVRAPPASPRRATTSTSTTATGSCGAPPSP